MMQRSIAAATMDTMDTMATMDTALLGFGCLWRCATLNNLAAIQGTCGSSLPYRTPVFVNADVLERFCRKLGPLVEGLDVEAFAKHIRPTLTTAQPLQLLCQICADSLLRSQC